MDKEQIIEMILNEAREMTLEEIDALEYAIFCIKRMCGEEEK
jgi:hypothetical protein